MMQRCWTVLWVLAGPLAALAGDWTSWRGEFQNGFVPENAVVTTWSLDGENLLWKSPIGGRTTPVIMGGRVFFNTQVGSGNSAQEAVVCLDADTGATLWDYRFNVFLTDIVEQRVGWTAMVGDPASGRVYVHGTGGEMICFDRDGAVQWRVSMTEQFGRISGYGGRLHNPILEGDLLIITYSNSSWGDQAPPRHRLLAMDKHTGEVVWWSAPGQQPVDATCYATPVTATIDGRRQLITATGDGAVYGLDARTGVALWSYPFSKRGLNASVVVDGPLVYASHSEENLDTTEMGAVVCLDARKRGDLTKDGVVWRRVGMDVGYASPALANGRLYVVDNSANLYAMEPQTGRTIWQHNFGRVGKGSPTVTADGVIYVAGQNGNLSILKDEGERCVVLDRKEFTRDDGLVDEAYGCAAIVDGRVVFQTRYATYCLGRKDASVVRATVSAIPAGRSALDAPVLLVTPGEITLRPGQSASFFAELHHDGRIELDPEGLEWSLAGIKGTLHPDGTLEVDPGVDFAGGHVVATVKGLEAKARVRVAPRDTFELDFEKLDEGAVPPGWVGVAGKTKVVARDGGKVFMKLAEKPSVPFTRIRGYMTPPLNSGYMLQADLLGAPKGERFKPDMGLINSRYTVVLRGMAQELQLVSWAPVPRIQKDVPFAWSTDVWYRVKFEVKPQEGDKAVVRAKVWPRDGEEPATWSIELVDDYPNTAGSPGLYGYSTGTTSKSKGTEIFYDNIKVTRER